MTRKCTDGELSGKTRGSGEHSCDGREMESFDRQTMGNQAMERVRNEWMRGRAETLGY